MYGESTAELGPGDSLVLYTDGITEAADPAGQEYGLDRLVEFCLRHRGEPLDELGRALEVELEAFVEGTPDADDRTLVIVRRTGG